MITNFRKEGRAIEKAKIYQTLLEERFNDLERRIKMLEKIYKKEKMEARNEQSRAVGN